MPACKNCGDQFKPSRSGAAVNCPSCRTPEGRRAKKQQTSVPSGPKKCVVCNGERLISSRSAVTGEVTRSPCHGCGGTGRKL